ncbi:hypothetical protein FACS1894202_10450 [Clostridia bacterium]|nr:hypothetical protein FACS1894202_10450 [Clostridia bacterium]
MKKLNQMPVYISIQLENPDSGRKMWLDLPVTTAKFADTLAEMGCGGNIRIADYRAYGIGSTRGEIMTTPLSVVNYLAARLRKLTPDEMLKLRAISESEHHFWQIGQIIDYTFATDNFTLLQGITDAEKLGLYYLGFPDYSVGGTTRKPVPRYEYGIKLAESEDGVFVPQG